MSDMQSMDRENKKRQLRQNIVQMPDAGSDEPMDDEGLKKRKLTKKADIKRKSGSSQLQPPVSLQHWDLPDTDI